MKISVITPSFNQAQFLPATLESVRSQKYQDIEHLILDPGSKDGSRKIIEEYCRNNGKARFYHGEDKSQTNAINLGFGRATGDIICWLNSDDSFFDSDILDFVAGEFKKNPDVDIIYGRGQFISPDGQVLKEAFINRDSKNLRKLMANSLGILQPSLFMRRSVFQEVGKLDENMNFSFDYEYWTRCAARGKKFHFVDRLISKAVIHDDAKTMRMRGTSLDEAIAVAHRYYDFCSMDWIRRKADFILNESDGIIKSGGTDEQALEKKIKEVFDIENSKSLALAAFFRNDENMNADTKKGFQSLLMDILSDHAYISGWDANYFDMGLTLIASIHRNDLDTWTFVYDLGMTKRQLSILKQLDRVILLDRDFVPFKHDWQRNPKNYVFKITLFNHMLTLLPLGCRLLWVDAGVMLLRDPREIFDAIRDNDVFFIDHSDSRHWPLFNASFTSDDAIREGRFSAAELAGPHVCSCLFGCKVGSPRQSVFVEAAEFAAIKAIAVGDKHPPAELCRMALPKGEQKAKAREFHSSRDPVSDLEQIRSVFGYYGHRQDQSIISLLATRHGLPISSAAHFCPANDESSKVSKENWLEGVSSRLGSFSPYPADQVGVTFHHRGLVKDFKGLRFALDQAPVAAILGNGPSLKEIDLPSLTDTDCFGMNAAYRFWREANWYPSYYSCLDNVVGLSHKEEIRELVRNRHIYGIKSFLLRQGLVDWLEKSGDLDDVIDFDLIRNGVPEFQPEPITTGSHTLAWAIFMGYKYAFISGVDCNYVQKIKGAEKQSDGTLKILREDENPNYFFAGYQKVGDQFNVPDPSKDLHIRSWRRVSEALPEDCKVLNVSSISLMDAFPMASLSEAFVRFSLGRSSKVISGSGPSISALLENDTLLSFCAARMMLDPEGMTRQIAADSQLAARIAAALDEGGAAADHYREVLAWAEARVKRDAA